MDHPQQASGLIYNYAKSRLLSLELLNRLAPLNFPGVMFLPCKVDSASYFSRYMASQSKNRT